MSALRSLVCLSLLLIIQVWAEGPTFLKEREKRPTTRAELEEMRKIEAEAYEVWMPSIPDFFLETFQDDDWLAKWVQSELEEYTGKWEVGSGPLTYGVPGEKGLLVKSVARKHAISHQFLDQVFQPQDQDFIVQYEVRMHNQWECGGAYLKLLTGNTEFSSKSFGADTPYTIMFGPDRCGTNNKVHFILRTKSPLTNEMIEHHSTPAPAVPNDKWTHLYSLVIHANNTYKIYVDGQIQTNGNLFTTLDPPINPPRTIDDPEDKKPEDWVDEAQIPDPQAVKPEGWDEDAPKYVIDDEAVMPSDWLVDEPQEVADPSAKIPEDWDEESDGEWEAPMVPNPVCETVSGCGPWTQPKKLNPDYKGKWEAPMIENPEYKGEWEPRQIENPNYYTIEKPSNIGPIVGLGIELWTMQSDLEFDNIYVGYDVEKALKFGNTTFQAKFTKQHQELGIEEWVDGRERRASSWLGFFDEYLTEWIDTVLDYPATVLITTAIGFVSLVYFLFFYNVRNDDGELQRALDSTQFSTEDELTQVRERIKKVQADIEKEKAKEKGEERVEEVVEEQEKAEVGGEQAADEEQVE